MCGSRHTFSRTETKYFVGATEIPANQLREIPGYRFAELFPHRREGFTLKYGVKPVQIPDRDRIPVAQQKEDHLATLGHWKHRRVERGEMTEAQYAAEMAAAEKNWSPSSAFAYLVTNATPPQAIDRVIKWERKEKQTMCGAKCRNARGPNCDCICEGKYHGAGMTNSRTRFAASDLDFKPTAEMAANAARGLELREKHGKGGTAVGVARARDIKNRANLSPDTVKRMHSFFSRHEGNQAGGEDDAGYIAWLLWGGDAGKAWAARKAAQIDKSESARGAARKASMALNPVIADALKFHTQKMGELLRQFISEAKQVHSTYADVGGAGRGFDPSWIAEQRGIVDNAISAMARGNIVGASNIVRQWADEFYGTYGHHEHSRNLAFLARAIAREPSHVVELAKAHKITLFRHSRKATMARELVGSKGNKRIYLGGPDGSGKYNLYLVQVANTGVPGESPAEDLIELKQFATEAKARSAAQKMLSSRPGAKARFGDQDPAKELLRVRIGSGTVSAKEFRDYAKQYVPGVSRSDSLADIIEKVNAALQRRGDSTRASMLVRGKDFSRPGAKAKMAATPHKVTYTDKSGVTHTYMVSDKILRAMNGTKKYAESVGSKPDYASVLRLGERTGEVIRASRPGKSSFSESAAWIAKYLPALNQWWRDRTDHPTDLDASSDRWEIEGVLDDVAEHCREAVPREAKPSWYAAALRDVKKIAHSANARKKTNMAVMLLGVEDTKRLKEKLHDAEYNHKEAVDWLNGLLSTARVRPNDVTAQSIQRAREKVTKTSQELAGWRSMAQRHMVNFSRPGAKARFATRSEAEALVQRYMDQGRISELYEVVRTTGYRDPVLERIRTNANISGQIAALAKNGVPVSKAIDDVLGSGTYAKLAGDVYDALRAKSGMSRPGAKARFANWEITPTKKHGQPIEEHTAKIGGKYFKIDTMPHLGADFGSLYVWDDLRGLKPIASGRIAALKRQAEALATNDALSRIILGEFSRPGAKAGFAHPSWSTGLLGKETAPQLAAYSWIDNHLGINGNRTQMLLADIAAEVHAQNPSLSIQQAILKAAQEMVQKGVATYDIRALVENRGWMSRPGAKATNAAENMYYTVAAHIGDNPAGERTTKSLDEAKAYAKAMLAALKPNAKGKVLVVDVYPVVNYSPQAPVLSLKASRGGAKADRLTLAQRIAVAHDAKRMALR